MRGRMPLSRRLLVSVLATIIAFPVGSWPPAVEGTTGGSPYDIPSVTDTNADPNIVETTITANETDVSIGGGITAHAYTYNDSIPGPEFRLTVGQRVIVHFHNELAEPTGIHWHGIELQNPSDGTPLTQNQVPAGGTFTYDFVVRRPGVYWYHPHHEFSTNQVFKGLYGSIIVSDPNEAALITAGRLPSLANTRTLALSDMTVCKAPTTNDTSTYNPALPWAGPGGVLPVQQTPTPAWLCEASTALDNHGELKGSAWAAGDVPNIQRHSQRVNEGQTVLTNGVNVGARAGTPAAPGAVDPGAYKLSMAPGQGLRLRIGNAATTRFFHLHLTNNAGVDQPLYRVGGEGGLLDAVELDGKVASGFDFDYKEGEILLDPGDRTDVVIAFPLAASGTWTLWTEDFRRSGGGDSATGWMNLPTVPVAHFDLSLPALVSAFSISEGTALRSFTGNPVEVLPAATGHLLDPLLFPTPELGSPLENIRITTSGGHPGIDGFAGTHDFTVDYTEQPHGDASRWALIGDVLQLTVTNESPADHPFHLHGFSIQPMTLTNCQVFGGGATPDYTFPHEFMDNIDIPGNCTLTLRVRLDDRPFPTGLPGGGLGGWMFHCHIFFHHHQGMVSELIVLRPTVTITNVAPAAVVPINTLVTVTTEVLGTAPTYNWDDLGATSVGTHTLGAEYTASHTFTQAGVYTVTATVANTVFPASDSVMIVVYDPSAGFVTGGGTITSGAGAYVATASLTGTASFGFVSKYKKGTNTPDGDTEFNFHVANFNFHSTAYQWLVVAGAKAQYKGTGTVNGTGNYGFLLSAVDGQVNGGGGVDKFRIKIWDINNGDAVVYDNNLGGSEDIDNANPQVLRSGTIVIHSK